jgi:hypothetical protein
LAYEAERLRSAPCSTFMKLNVSNELVKLNGTVAGRKKPEVYRFESCTSSKWTASLMVERRDKKREIGVQFPDSHP